MITQQHKDNHKHIQSISHTNTITATQQTKIQEQTIIASIIHILNTQAKHKQPIINTYNTQQRTTQHIKHAKTNHTIYMYIQNNIYIFT